MTIEQKRKAVFIDRDGTLIEEVNFLSRLEDLSLFEFTDESVRMLKDSGYLIVVVTNQSGIGRGLYDESAMHAIHDEIQLRLSDRIDGFYYCPHVPDAGCQCRKPGLAMIETARKQLNIDLENSWMIGDKDLDVETGLNAGLRTVLVLTGYGRKHSRHLKREPHLVTKNLLEAAKRIAAGKDQIGP